VGVQQAAAGLSRPPATPRPRQHSTAPSSLVQPVTYMQGGIPCLSEGQETVGLHCLL
jgi:hypothetical protein